MNPEEQLHTREIRDEPPPFLGSWPRVYIFVIVYLFALIGAFYAFTLAFKP